MQRSTSLQHAPCLDAKHSSFHHKVGECFEQNTSTVDKYHLPKNNTSYTLGPLTLNAMSHALPLSISWIKANRSTTFRSMFELGRLDQIVPYVQALIHHCFKNYGLLALLVFIITLRSHWTCVSTHNAYNPKRPPYWGIHNPHLLPVVVDNIPR